MGGLPGYPAAADVPTPAVVEEKCRDGQELPGMELDVMQGNPTDVRSLVFAAPPESGRSPGVIVCQVDPIAAPVSWMLRPGMNSDGCSGTPMEEPDIPLREMLRLMDQSAEQEVKSLDREILSLVRNLGGNANSYR